jgi:hypothetical protein
MGTLKNRLGCRTERRNSESNRARMLHNLCSDPLELKLNLFWRALSFSVSVLLFFFLRSLSSAQHSLIEIFVAIFPARA